MKYLVGAANNTWRLPDAIQAAADGDTIEFQAGYSPVVDTIILNKSLHFKGKVTTGEGGNRNFTNVITGKFNIRQQANVTFREFPAVIPAFRSLAFWRSRPTFSGAGPEPTLAASMRCFPTTEATPGQPASRPVSPLP